MRRNFIEAIKALIFVISRVSLIDFLLYDFDIDFVTIEKDLLS